MWASYQNILPDPRPRTVEDESEIASKLHAKKIGESIFAGRPPFCQGTLQLPSEDFSLFYKTDRATGDSCYVDLVTATPEQLDRLAEACDPATFGRNQANVYDETYRKAGKLDAANFAIKFDPTRCGIVDIIQTLMVEEGRCGLTRAGLGVRAELYKLNVYGNGAFFKPHVDTPRSTSMFASLVVVFPTRHEGGELVIRYQKSEGISEHAFDTTSLLADKPKPSIAYVAFYSDVEHEVHDGHRVTLTYNLYYTEDEETQHGASTTLSAPLNPASEGGTEFKTRMTNAIEDPFFLPNGGYIVICLHHQYPLPTTAQSAYEARAALKNVAKCLKGIDAEIWHVLRDLELDVVPKVVYYSDSEYERALLDHYASLDLRENIENGLAEHFRENERGMLVSPGVGSSVASYPPSDDDFVDPNGRFPEALFINWKHWEGNMDETPYMAYGNESTLETAYWRVGLFVRIGPFGARAMAPSEYF